MRTENDITIETEKKIYYISWLVKPNKSSYSPSITYTAPFSAYTRAEAIEKAKEYAQQYQERIYMVFQPELFVEVNLETLITVA